VTVYNANGLNYLRHTDWLGSSRLATTWAHGVYSKESYAPFGEAYNEAGTQDRSFTGQDQSTTPAVYDFMFRKYDPTAGRWLSPDPAGWDSTDATNPQSLNRYAYTMNNPLSNIDLLGLDCFYVDEAGNVTGWNAGDCDNNRPDGGNNAYYVNCDNNGGDGCTAGYQVTAFNTFLGSLTQVCTGSGCMAIGDDGSILPPPDFVDHAIPPGYQPDNPAAPNDYVTYSNPPGLLIPIYPWNITNQNSNGPSVTAAPPPKPAPPPPGWLECLLAPDAAMEIHELAMQEYSGTIDEEYSNDTYVGPEGASYFFYWKGHLQTGNEAAASKLNGATVAVQYLTSLAACKLSK
jgi:RHS repeat-associated protein